MATTGFTLAYWCVLIAAFLPMGCSTLAKLPAKDAAGNKNRFDNNDPRAWLARQTDWRARANAAQANSFEALPFFIGAVIIAHQLGAAQGRVDVLAMVYIVLRLMYIMFYVGGLASLRSLIWTLALGVNIAILFAGYH